MWRRPWGLARAFVAIGAFALSISSLAQADTGATREELATMVLVGGTMTFPSSTSQALTLKVGGEGYQSRQRFERGQTPWFGPVDEKGFILPDGVYVWELIENPEPPPECAARTGKPPDGRDTHRMPAPTGRRQSGAFSIRNGRLVDPDGVEPVKRSDPAGRLREAAQPEHPAGFDDADGAAEQRPHGTKDRWERNRKEQRQ